MRPVDTEGVQRISAAFYRAFESLDLARMEEVWSHDDHVVCVHPGWERLVGWKLVRASWEQIFANTIDIQFHVEQASLRISDDLAIMSVTENLRSHVADGGVVGQVLATNVFERHNELWRVVAHHATPFVARQTPPGDGMVH